METTLDAGREHWRVDTQIDEGRDPHRRGEAEIETEVDEGRRRPDDPWRERLPPALDARYEVVERLTDRAVEGDLYLVRERGSGRRRVLKVYAEGRRRDERVWTVLRTRRTGHLVELVEAGREAGRDYEVQEYLAGGDLLQLRRRHPGGLDEATLSTVVEHVVTALIELHGHGVVHRDIKPANLVRRRPGELDVVVVDTGISTVAGAAPTPSAPGTVAYAPPEWDSGRVGAPADWWALGITLVELATGRHPFEGLGTGPIRLHVTTRPIDLSAIKFARIRRLCQGLLLRDITHRWGGDLVWRWVSGEDPRIHRDEVPDSHPGGVAEPFLFRDQPFHHRDLLALELANAWEAAANHFFGADGQNLARLVTWLAQFPEFAGEVGDARLAPLRRLAKARAPADVRLLRLLHRLDPARPPTYRREVITPARLTDLARVAVAGGAARAVVVDLWRHKLLPVLATSGSTEESGTGLVEADQAWRAERDRWDEVVAEVGDPAARQELLDQDPEVVLAACLLSSTLSDRQDRRLTQPVRETERQLATSLPWYGALTAPGRPTLSLVVAWLLRRTATRLAQELHEGREVARHRREWARRNQSLARWSRRQSRIMALGWAVAGTAVVAAVWMLLISASDSAQRADDAAITDGWVASILSIGVILAIEGVLAVMIGARYPLRFSLPAAGLIALRPLAARARQHGVVALLVLVVVVAVVGGFAVAAPQLVPAVTTAAVLIWAVRRYGAWLREVRQEEEEASDAAARQRDERTRAVAAQTVEPEGADA